MNELQSGPTKRPATFTGASDDALALRSLVGMINDPNITGAEVPKEEKPVGAMPAAALPLAMPGLPGEKLVEATEAQPVIVMPPASQPAAVAAKPEKPTTAVAADVRRLFFTGASKSGKSYLASQLGAVVVEFLDPVYAMARLMFGEDVDAASLKDFTRTMACWGEGVITQQAPLTAERGIACDLIRRGVGKWERVFGIPTESFGTPDFWTQCLLAKVRKSADKLVAVTSVPASDRYLALKDAGFRPYHVMCNNLTRSARGGAAGVNPLVDGIERDITLKLSSAPQGAKLWAIWSDDRYPAPSKRLLTVDEFLTSIKG